MGMTTQLARSHARCYAAKPRDRLTQGLRQGFTKQASRPAMTNTGARMHWCQDRMANCTALASSSAAYAPARDPQGPLNGSGGGGHSGGGGDGASGGDGHGGNGQPFPAMLGLLLAAGLAANSLCCPSPANAWGQKADKQRKRKASALPDSSELDEFTNRMVALAGPILTNMGFSGVVGACAAAALKSVGRSLAALVGVVFVGMQVLTYYGFITVNWTKVSDAASQALDATGDGRLDDNDLRRWIKKGMVLMSHGLPSTSGFLFGFTAGLKMF